LNFSARLHTKERLDDLSLSGKPLLEALSSLKLINTFFGNHIQLTKSILKYCDTHSEDNVLRVVDLGCGGGDTIYYISKKLSQKGIKASFIGIDGNPESTRHATSTYAHEENLSFITDDILDSKFAIPECDLIISSHFIYHFKDDELVQFIKQAKQKNIKKIIFSELKRSKVAFYLFKFSNIMLPISGIAKKDGLLAIRRAFTIEELRAILNKSTATAFNIDKKNWFRTLTKIDL